MVDWYEQRHDPGLPWQDTGIYMPVESAPPKKGFGGGWPERHSATAGSCDRDNDTVFRVGSNERLAWEFVVGVGERQQLGAGTAFDERLDFD